MTRAGDRLLATGASQTDLRLVLRATAYEAVFGTLYALSDPGADDTDMLYEGLQTADPSGMDGRPGSADAVQEIISYWAAGERAA